ncbi:RNA-binding ATPase activator esf2 [Cadophora gregata]|uniref:RNA-binding ATPase activator esf2 n=1 Tax=Cadophora gregata TaxID=51156 RepID=UPI0026DDA6C3|nr:RNA-binding ATPase activator esf2 [Cadophora gregata]KAK0119842.1 RNA-binding ATPase activator esf2 [Cadophora gregata]KAK0120877.1 RNA-binding ATPase activator esf2 [Cadophora gregata f. sp. sojae]
MTTRKHNEFLDADDSEDDRSQGYDSEIEDVKKGGGRSFKRRKVDSDLSDEDEGELHDNSEEEKEEDKKANQEEPKDTIALKKVPRNANDTMELPGVSKPLSKKNLVATAAAIKKSGVVYLSRIPPFMKPQKLRSLLEPYGPINRIFMTPEDPASHTRRVRNGGNKKRSFVDGWVEFVNKVHAKHVCELLNAKTIGGKKGTYYHDDVWNLLYLKGFKWNNLTEQIATENAERASRMRAEISKTTKENKEFVQNVERAKMLEGMEAKKAAKRRKDLEDTRETNVPPKAEKMGGERARQFKQTPVAAKRRPEDQPEQVKRVLSKIF